MTWSLAAKPVFFMHREIRLSTEMEAAQQYGYEAGAHDAEKQNEKKEPLDSQDAFGDEEYAEVKYKVLSWW